MNLLLFKVSSCSFQESFPYFCCLFQSQGLGFSGESRDNLDWSRSYIKRVELNMRVSKPHLKEP